MAHTTELERHLTADASYLDYFQGVDLRRMEITCMCWAMQNFRQLLHRVLGVLLLASRSSNVFTVLLHTWSIWDQLRWRIRGMVPHGPRNWTEVLKSLRALWALCNADNHRVLEFCPRKARRRGGICDRRAYWGGRRSTNLRSGRCVTRLLDRSQVEGCWSRPWRQDGMLSEDAALPWRCRITHPTILIAIS